MSALSQRKRILIVSHYAGGARHGMVYRNYVHAREWVKAGHEVTVVAASYSHTRREQPVVPGAHALEHIDGIRYLWLRTPTYSPKSMLGRVLSMFWFTIRMYGRHPVLRESYDVVMLSVPQPFAVYPTRAIARRSAAPLVLDIRDLWPLTLTLLGGTSSRHPFIRLVGAAERAACSAADLVTAVPRNAEAYLMSRGLRKGRFLPMGNGVMVDELGCEQLPAQHREYLSQLRASGAFLIGYAGAVGLANALHVAVEALAMLSSNVHLVIVGEGPERGALQSNAERLGIQNRLHWLIPVRRDQVPDFLEHVDVAYAGALASPLYQYGASFTKLNDYMMASKPVVYAVGDPGNGVEASGCGVSCPAEDVVAVADGIKWLMRLSADELAALGDRGHNWCAVHQDAARQAQQILDTLERGIE
ncbi:glycosyltransferase WbuB [Pandoraea eparura]|uniref:Glycosyltransferase WbuB n=1 Tax=Pandoraea eparura TaxID=2508291 RepID=A0A5E4WB27_9BURK|nr:glycosyltransferase family 4 protein [Pandoraea eparura]VVE20305.1 glycosyltransferase WbuB [Pandoraea eparura]